MGRQTFAEINGASSSFATERDIVISRSMHDQISMPALSRPVLVGAGKMSVSEFGAADCTGALALDTFGMADTPVELRPMAPGALARLRGCSFFGIAENQLLLTFAILSMLAMAGSFCECEFGYRS